MSDDTYSMTVKLQRGTSTDDRDTQKVTVTAQTIGELAERVEEVREKMEGWAGDWRAIQPDPMIKQVCILRAPNSHGRRLLSRHGH